MLSFISRLIRLWLRLLFWAFAAVGLLSLLAISLVLLLLALLRGWITGKPTAAGMAFNRFNQFRRFSSQDLGGRWPGTETARPAATRARPLGGSANPAAPRAHAPHGDVVDVQARDLPADKPGA